MSNRTGNAYVLRVIVVNAFVIVGFVQAFRTGKLTGSIIALYIVMAVVANTLMFFGARARRRMQDR